MEKSMRFGKPAESAPVDALSNDSVKSDAQGRSPLRGSNSLIAAYFRR
jgi:hypothetical protein